MGNGALGANTTASNNTAIGSNALLLNTTGHSNVAMGHDAAEGHTTGEHNTIIGFEASKTANTGNNNTSVGTAAGYSNSAGDNNTNYGRASGYQISTGNENVCIGRHAGFDVTSGDQNVCIGPQAGRGQVTTTDGDLYIARSNTAAGNSNTWIAGNSSGTCYQGDNTTSWSTVSDRRLKKNITDNTKGLAEIDQLRVANFEYRTREEIDMSEFPLANDPGQVVLGEGNEGVHIGVIAQEIEAVLPECIITSSKGAKTVDTDPITWAMVNAIKELSAEVTALKAQINN